ncbi:MAG: chemotaxis response regulator protein-glutamate methylesterase [Desulfatibacillaceae bacterium]
MKKLRVLIVDDSPVVQAVLSRILSAEPDIEVVGRASDPFEAKRWIVEETPDVVTLDVEMPRMDGITFLKRLMAYRPLPVIMISSLTQENSMRTLEALDAGAVDFVAKPLGDTERSLDTLAREIVSKVRAAGKARVKPSYVRRTDTAPPRSHAEEMSRRIFRLVAIGASTGGTQAIQRLLSAMHYGTNGIVIVQHMPPRYTTSFAHRLDNMLPLDVREAEDRDRIEKNAVLVAPGGKHMRVVRDGNRLLVRLDENSPPVHHQRPAVDVLFRSVAENVGRESVGVVLTGMGDDGADGLLAMREAGAFTVAQDEPSSVVFGMPRAAVERGAAKKVAPLGDIADVIYRNTARHTK